MKGGCTVAKTLIECIVFGNESLYQVSARSYKGKLVNSSSQDLVHSIKFPRLINQSISDMLQKVHSMHDRRTCLVGFSLTVVSATCTIYRNMAFTRCKRNNIIIVTTLNSAFKIFFRLDQIYVKRRNEKMT